MGDQAGDVQGLTIEAAAERTGISRHTLRYYERIGLLAPVGRTASGLRRYTDDDLGGIMTLERLHGHLAALDHKIGVYTLALEAEKESV
jgi:DNA-binding transcriptional MerR regulator